jgi:hypothetical protein
VCDDWTYCNVHIYVFEVEERGKKHATQNHTALPHHGNTPEHDSEQETVILKVDVVDYEKPGVKEHGCGEYGR